MSLARKYDKSLSERWFLRLKTTHPRDDKYDGVIVLVKPSFVVLREARDFEFDGVVVLPKRVIKGVRDGRYERCYNEVLRHNGAIERLRPMRWLDRCETMPQVVAALMRRGVWPVIEVTFEQCPHSALYIGPITRIGSDRFFLKCYDAAGKWEKEYELSFDEVFRIEFDDKYSSRFNAYIRSRDRGERNRMDGDDAV